MIGKVADKIRNYKTIFLILILPCIYYLGYFEYKLFLYTLDLHIIPTDVYTKLDIFLSGLHIFALSIIFPIISYLSCHVNEAGKYTWRDYGAYYVQVFAYSSIFFLLWFKNQHINSIFFNLSRVFYDNALQIYVGVILLVIVLIIISSIIFAIKTKGINKTRMLIFIISLILWSSSVCLINSNCFYDILSGAQPNEISLVQKGLHGYICTKTKISECSIPRGDNSFQTGGLLLNTKNGMCYFRVGTFAGFNRSKEKLYVIPEKEILYFYIPR